MNRAFEVFRFAPAAIKDELSVFIHNSAAKMGRCGATKCDAVGAVSGKVVGMLRKDMPQPKRGQNPPLIASEGAPRRRLTTGEE